MTNTQNATISPNDHRRYMVILDLPANDTNYEVWRIGIGKEEIDNAIADAVEEYGEGIIDSIAICEHTTLIWRNVQ